MTKILGLDLGTNSIGWAVVDKENGDFNLKRKGVRIFQEGVKFEKGSEISKAAERTNYRSARKLKYRRRIRKINTLRVLSKNNFCPKITEEELKNWKYKKKYPQNPEFQEWLRTNEDENKNPYYYRALAVEEKLNMSFQEDRYKIGRAFYHIAQRRGFLSNRLDKNQESEGAVKKEINQINEEKGDRTLGQFFYQKYKKGEKIRGYYTHREQHYLEEFLSIIKQQELSNHISKELHNAIFYQRPLKSQKGLIGKCVFEPTKQRCSVSRPEFEEYRMLSFINNIKIKTPQDENLRSLNQGERESIRPLFYRKKELFQFEDISKKLANKFRYSYYKDDNKDDADYLFNYKMNTTVFGCPVSARLISIFGEDYMNIKHAYKKEESSNMSFIDISDIWHVLYTFDSNTKLEEFAKLRLGLNDAQIKEFLKINLNQAYSALSLKAINNILPFLRRGLLYSHAVFLAKIPELLPDGLWLDESNRDLIETEIDSILRSYKDEKIIIDVLNGYIKYCRENDFTWSKEAKASHEEAIRKRISNRFGKKCFEQIPDEKKDIILSKSYFLFKKHMTENFGKGRFIKSNTIEEEIKEFLKDNFGIDENNLKKLYHPSAIEVYEQPKKNKDGIYLLGSPRTSSIRNPMAMRTLFQLRKLINELIKIGEIDQFTQINIEMSRDLKNANERKAIQEWQYSREQKRKEYAKRIKEYYEESRIDEEPSENDILKYQLWEEQNHKCVYTGNEIAVYEFLGKDPRYDIEHTIPRSISLDNSQKNKTLCENVFNRKIKKDKIPFELSNWKDILQRIEPWKAKAEELDKQIKVVSRKAKAALTPETKNRFIKERHRLKFEHDYYYDKYYRFTMKDVPDGFKNSQLVDTGIITKYARLYLKTYFSKVYSVKGIAVATFRRAWGLQENYEQKERVNHVHHCIDAITISCMTKENYEKLAHYYYQVEDAYWNYTNEHISFKKPWKTFTEDLKNLEKEVLVSHYTPDKLTKHTKKKIRKKGIIQYSSNGKAKYMQGDTSRQRLHQETFYGAIQTQVKDKKGEIKNDIKYVVRDYIENLSDSDLDKIVDEHIKAIVKEARKKEKDINTQIEKLKKKLRKVEEVEESVINDEIVHLEKKKAELYGIPSKNGKVIPIKKVRLFTRYSSLLELKEHQQLSNKAHKRKYYVVNDGNYLMALYEGINEKGKVVRDFEIVNRLDAADYDKKSNENETGGKLIPLTKNRGGIDSKLKSQLKIGKLVVLYDNNVEEIFTLSNEEIARRLYKIVGLSEQVIQGKYHYGTIVLKLHNEARPTSDLKVADGKFKQDEIKKTFRKLNHNQFDAIVEGEDFTISPLGELEFKQ